MTLSLLNAQIYSGNLILVNREFGFVEQSTDELLPVQEEFSHIKMQRRAVVLLSKLLDDIQAWNSIVPVSGWRSLQEQQDIWDDTRRERGLEFAQKYVALPGHSEHQTGLAIDLGLKQDKIDFVCPEFPYHGICQTFRSRAADYGFVERYPAGKEHITGIGHEPWHFRYVGIPHAKIMARNELTLEEYISFIKQFPYGKRRLSIQLGGQGLFVSYRKADIPDKTELNIDERAPYSLSGNNMDGFILTEWRKPNACKAELWGA